MSSPRITLHVSRRGDDIRVIEGLGDWALGYDDQMKGDWKAALLKAENQGQLTDYDE